ncbi:MAG: hypothetical protein OQJ97_15025 [Rhodospirillales bacterium]|nr:hypothetical protein [Rhodospirillales bacterium]
MEVSASTLVRAGGRDQLLEDFRALADATTFEGVPRYSDRPTLAWLAKFLAGQAGGPNKDLPLFELCHLVNALDRGNGSPDFRTLFFLGGERAVPQTYKRLLDPVDFLEGVKAGKEGITLCYPEGDFTIRFGRMPMLGALFEFLASMEDFAFYTEFNTIFDELAQAPFSVKSTQAASNRLSSNLRQYRKKYFITAEHDGKFMQLLGFLKERNSEKEIFIDDDAILDFWLLHSQGKEFKGYRTVFELFITFMNAFDETKSRESAHGATRLGTDWESGEVDIDIENGVLEGMGDWQSPLSLFDEEPVASVKFFKKTGERKPLEALMSFGPKATSLPLAFLRYESFGQVQAGITNDLQVGRDTVKKRLTCDEAEPYQDKHTVLASLFDHVRELQKAAFHVIAGKKPDGNVVAFPGTEEVDNNALEAAQVDAAKAFKKLTRMGFDDEVFTDPTRERAFRLAAGALLTIGGQLQNFLTKAEPMINQFDQDKTVFAQQFNILYGEQS